MSTYTTGEVAKLCDVSVRTVQYYDTKGLVHPSATSAGGRRIYTARDLDKMRLACLLRGLGFSLTQIKRLFASAAPKKVLLVLLDEQEKQLQHEMASSEQRLVRIRQIKARLCGDAHGTHGAASMTASSPTVPDIEHTMESKRKLRRLHIALVAVGIPMDIIEVGTLALWIITGIWWPFALGMALAIAMGLYMTRRYNRDTVYICPECKAAFQPKFLTFMFAAHMPKTRKLTCPSCGTKGYCVEAYKETA
jgi:DNA-binding transcriptional MerR regulator/DNA-directed RNA polymerase subunit RPC12/RpoP